MSIPLDRLYHYIESVASEILKSDTIIYRFYPHGSKNFNNLQLLKTRGLRTDYLTLGLTPLIFCNDQEPLNFDFYQDLSRQKNAMINYDKSNKILSFFADHPEYWTRFNLQVTQDQNIFDHCIILHSEINSDDEIKYRENNFIPVYYWSHALIAHDWFRYVKHVDLKKDIKKTFLVYNRAWTGTREYRIKFADLLVSHHLVDDCKTSFSFNCDGNYYKDHLTNNCQFSIHNHLEDFFYSNNTTPEYSAEVESLDYQDTMFEVVLETLFDDSRIHLTEKSLRPIAVGQPFIIASTPGSLNYLKKYGFKTFDSIIDESYDNIKDPVERLNAIVKVMKTITEWTAEEKKKNLSLIKKITKYNKKYFFSDKFFNLITDELKTNLTEGLRQVEILNKAEKFFQHRKNIFQSSIKEEFKQYEKTSVGPVIVQHLITAARKYKIRNNKY